MITSINFTVFKKIFIWELVRSLKYMYEIKALKQCNDFQDILMNIGMKVPDKNIKSGNRFK